MDGRSRRRLSGFFAGIALAVVCAAAAYASVGKLEQPGVFALLGGTPKIVSEFWAVHGQGLSATLNVRQYRQDGKTLITAYDVDMQKRMHVIVIRDDFAAFAHLHPDFDAKTGTFRVAFTKGPNHRYYVYADSVPTGIGQQVFRFTIESDGPLVKLPKSPGPSWPPNVHAGPYTVILQKTTIPANTPTTLDLVIVKGDDPADDLAPYLGAAAHVVLIDRSTLAYVHVHPMLKGQATSMGSMSPEAMEAMESSNKAGPMMMLHLPALPPGTYAVWVQFKGGASKTLYTAPLTILAK